ncbi:uncharacterized protein FIBRA_05609 [Fibroporia radiculosa]|uniref:Protein kinase domain-containing protein n=1 Tax=Fibroporia radiculosa TaxID=599839 RepID=J4IAT6_9APHY|nr:uncharacterized protein FIBRA_05609 [Fibroporia radiculosa]CCM03476.1 predicted protein [Fibroporia radiculosa]
MDRSSHLPAYAYISPEKAQLYAEDTRKGFYGLSPAEKLWKDRQPFLERTGYTLRKRYYTDWTPSWIGKNVDPIFCEDSIMLNNYNVIDAIRCRDGMLVAIKTTRGDTDEIAIAKFLSSPDLINHPSNHCAPLIDLLPDPLGSSKMLMVTPYLRPFDDPEFGVVGEVLDFVFQTLQGLQFLHQCGVAHRDCASANIMMDGRSLYPQGHHPIRDHCSLDGVVELVPLSRIDHPVRYYFIDFGISTRFSENSSPLVLGKNGRDQDVPELSSDVPYDAYKVDIFVLGNVYDKEFIQKYHGLDFLQSLVGAMKQSVPGRRPTAQDTLKSLEEIQATLSSVLLRWRLRPRSETPPERILHDTVAAAREGIYHLKRLVT